MEVTGSNPVPPIDLRKRLHALLHRFLMKKSPRLLQQPGAQTADPLVRTSCSKVSSLDRRVYRACHVPGTASSMIGGWLQLNGQQVKLAKGKKNRHEADQKFHELLLQRDKNPAPATGQPTVASIIDLYLSHANRRYSPRTLVRAAALSPAYSPRHTAGAR